MLPAELEGSEGKATEALEVGASSGSQAAAGGGGCECTNLRRQLAEARQALEQERAKTRALEERVKKWRLTQAGAAEPPMLFKVD